MECRFTTASAPNAGVDKRLTPKEHISLALRARRESLDWSQETLAFGFGGRAWRKDVTLLNSIRIARSMQSTLAELLLEAEL